MVAGQELELVVSVNLDIAFLQSSRRMKYLAPFPARF
jgi:hypothetical protein